MNNEVINDYNSIDTDEHILHMWQPFDFEVNNDYDYLRNGFTSRLGTTFLRGFAFIVLSIYNKITLGFKINGKENLKQLSKNEGAVIISNHIHPMDCTMIDLALFKKRMYYITLESNFKIPFIRHLVRILGGVPLSSSYHCIGDLFSEMGKALKDGACVQIYPEGILYPYYEGLREFKNGAFHLSVSNDIPILPMVITQHSPRGIYKLYKKKPCLHLNILSPLYPNINLSKRDAVEELKQDCINAMNSCLDLKTN